MKNTATSKQVKVLTDAKVADEFKDACNKAGTSMTNELSRFMSDYCKAAKKRHQAVADVSTRRNRRKQVDKIIDQMERIMDAEMRYCDNFPVNLRASKPFGATEESISIMNEVIDSLGTIYR